MGGWVGFFTYLFGAFIGLVQAQLVEEATGNQETRAVGGGVVLQTDLLGESGWVGGWVVMISR